MAEREKKNIITDALNALSSKDEKAALEAANRRIAELEAKLTSTEKDACCSAGSRCKPVSQLAVHLARISITETLGESSI